MCCYKTAYFKWHITCAGGQKLNHGYFIGKKENGTVNTKITMEIGTHSNEGGSCGCVGTEIDTF